MKMKTLFGIALAAFLTAAPAANAQTLSTVTSDKFPAYDNPISVIYYSGWKYDVVINLGKMSMAPWISQLYYQLKTDPHYSAMLLRDENGFWTLHVSTNSKRRLNKVYKEIKRYTTYLMDSFDPDNDTVINQNDGGYSINHNPIICDDKFLEDKTIDVAAEAAPLGDKMIGGKASLSIR